MMSMGCVLGMLGCEDRMDSPAPSAGEGKPVEVTLHVGIADEVDAASQGSDPAGTKAAGVGDQSAFDVRLIPAAATKADTEDVLATAKPDKLYNLQILQYDSNKNFKKLATVGTQDIGAALSFTLTAANNCHLIIIARGASGAIPAITGSPTWSTLQGVLADYNTVNNLTDINNMPYFIHLPNVNVTDEGRVIQSADGKDARVLLKRLAVRLTVKWSFTSNPGENTLDNYTLKEVKLCQVPSVYYLLPQTESDSRFEGDLYPISTVEYTDLRRLTGVSATSEGSLTAWIPANAKGKSRQVTSVNYRTKEYAHSSATYMEFVVDKEDQSERLYYRAYLGGKAVSDFNLLENTNYKYTIHISSVDYRNDPRIRLLDQTPVKSTNLVPTSNCFMMRPGTNICFNPYLHEASGDGTNTYLNDKTIGSVRVLWQNKDAGTSGDLVMGYVINNESGSYNHQNLVNYTDIGDKTKALVHVKVPVTQGGNAVIAAYDAAGTTILWSWHIWITDYVPAPLSGDITTVNRLEAITSAQNATQGGMVHVYGGISWTEPDGSFYKCVIMDRNLGATRGGLQQNTMDWVRTFGLLYQGGRKDPIFGTPDGGTDEKRTIYDGSGYALSLNKSGVTPTLDQMIQNPLIFYKDPINNWNGDKAKTIQDPCPKGWRIPSNEYLNNGSAEGIMLTPNSWDGFIYTLADSKASLCAGFGRTEPSYVCEWNKTEKNNNNIMFYNGSRFISLIGQGYGGAASTANTDAFSGTGGAGYIYFGGSHEDESEWTNKSAFFPTAILRERGSGNFRDNLNNKLFLWSSSNNRNGQMQMYEFQSGLLSFQHTNPSGYGFSVRCVQDNIKDRSYLDYQADK